MSGLAVPQQWLVDLAKEWAADDRKWSTQQVVELNLLVFARKVLANA